MTPRRFRVCTTDSHHDLPIAPNRLDQKFAAERPNQVWLADITYVPTGRVVISVLRSFVFNYLREGFRFGAGGFPLSVPVMDSIASIAMRF
jgi:transposase InsO family protein